MKKSANESNLTEAVIYFIMAFGLAILMMVLCTSCSQPAPPQEPTKTEIQDSVKLEIAEKKLNYILQSVKRNEKTIQRN